jgi:glycosyltransferase involved in cell wall biosynthesis
VTARRAPLRVLLVTGAYAPEISSGGLQCQAVARNLRGRAEVRVLTTAVDSTLRARDIIEGVGVSRVGIDVGSRCSKARATVRILAELSRVVPCVDVVHLHGFSQKNIPVTGVARMFGRPIVLSLHTAGFDEPSAIAGQGVLARRTFSAAALYLCVSPRLVDACLAAGLPPDRVLHVPNGVDLDRFRPATSGERTTLRRRLGLPVDRPIILFVGMFSRDKQPDVLFDAWLGLQQDTRFASTLVCVGATRSSYFEVDERLAADLRGEADRSGFGERVVFVEPTNQVHDYFRAADVFALPSAREGLPVALLEAMATGLPSVASRLAGSTDVIVEHAENGVLVPSGDAVALANALRGLLGDPELAARMGAAARARVARDYSVEQTANRWYEAYQNVLETSGRRWGTV